MSMGARIRGLFGPYEHKVAALYRSIFIDLDDYARQLPRWLPEAARILEVGCGEGAVTEKLAAQYPHADITAIDLTSRAGRLYRGRRDGVRFLATTVQDIARDHPGAFDVILLSDVIHHVPPPIRAEIIDAIGVALAPGGTFLFKDWGRSLSPIHWLCHAADRWITGDRVKYLTPKEALALVRERLPDIRIVDRGHVRPWKNNFAFVLRG